MPLTQTEAIDARQLAAEGHPLQAIADLLGVSKRTIYRHLETERVTEEQADAVREAYEKLRAARDSDSPQSRLLAGIFGDVTPETGPFGADPAPDPRPWVDESEVRGLTSIPDDVQVRWLGRANGHPVHPVPMIH